MGADIKTIEDYQRKFNVVLDVVSWQAVPGRDSNAEDRYVFVYPEAAYYNGQKNLPENFFVFSVAKKDKDCYTIRHTTFWNSRNGEAG